MLKNQHPVRVAGNPSNSIVDDPAGIIFEHDDINKHFNSSTGIPKHPITNMSIRTITKNKKVMKIITIIKESKNPNQELNILYVINILNLSRLFQNSSAIERKNSVYN